MKFFVNSSEFSKMVSAVSRLLPQKTTNPLFGSVLIEVKESKCEISVFNYDILFKSSFDIVKEKEGKAVVDIKLLNDIILKFPKGEIILEKENNSLKISSQKISFNLQLIETENFKIDDSLKIYDEIDKWDLEIASRDFNNAVKQVFNSVSKQELSPVLTGVDLKIKDNKLLFLSTDRYRASKKEIDIKSDADKEIVIPGKIFFETVKIFESGTMKIKIDHDDKNNKIVLNNNKTQVVLNGIQGQYPDLTKIFSLQYENYIVANKEQLKEAIRRVSVILHQGGAVQCSLKENQIEISAKTDISKAEEEIKANLIGEKAVIHLNPQYLLDGVESIDGDIKISFAESGQQLSPVLLSCDLENNDYLYVLQQIRFDN